MASGGIQWIWSAQHNNYYFITYDEYKRPIFNFAPPNYNQPTDPVSPQIRNQLTSFIPGDPSSWREPLDNSYQMHNGIDAQRFFEVGRVFAMLYTEAAGATAVFNNKDEAFSEVLYGETAYSSIRRFVVVDKRRGFVYACAITTYQNRGTLKTGCVPSEHSVVYLDGTTATAYEGEYERGMTKQPIKVVPCDQSVMIKPGSRLRFGKHFSLEMNVKVKNIGQVHADSMPNLIEYYEEYK